MEELNRQLSELSQRITCRAYEVNKLRRLLTEAEMKLQKDRIKFERIDYQLAELDGRLEVLKPSKPRAPKTRKESNQEIDQAIAKMNPDQLQTLIHNLMECKSFK